MKSSPTYGTTSISGILKDSRQNPIVNAKVESIADDRLIAEAYTDFDGLYLITGILPEYYDIRFTFKEKELRITGIAVNADISRVINGIMPLNDAPFTIYTCFRNRSLAPLLDPRHPGGTATHTGAMLWQ